VRRLRHAGGRDDGGCLVAAVIVGCYRWLFVAQPMQLVNPAGQRLQCSFRRSGRMLLFLDVFGHVSFAPHLSEN
jgi:hypothetical protein